MFLEDGIEQPISLFSVETFPLSAIVLVDDDLKTKTLRERKTEPDGRRWRL